MLREELDALAADLEGAGWFDRFMLEWTEAQRRAFQAASVVEKVTYYESVWDRPLSERVDALGSTSGSGESGAAA